MLLKKLVRLGTAASVITTAIAMAHPSNAMYERDKVIEVAGTVREFQWTNPHIFIELTVEGRAPVKRVGVACRWCPIAADCAEGQSFLHGGAGADVDL